MAQFDHLINELAVKLNASKTEVGGNFLMKIPINGNEIQETMFITLDNSANEKILKFFSIAGKIEKNEEMLYFLLKNNLGMDYGCFAVMILNNEDQLVVADSCLLDYAKFEEVFQAVQYITRVAFDAKKRIASGQNPL